MTTTREQGILDEVARQTFGQDVRVKDPGKFELFLRQKADQFQAAQPQRPPLEFTPPPVPQPPPQTGPTLPPAEQERFALELAAAEAGIPIGNVAPEELAALVAQTQQQAESVAHRQAIAQANALDLLMGPAAQSFSEFLAGTGTEVNLPRPSFLPVPDRPQPIGPETFKQAFAEEQLLPPEQGRIFQSPERRALERTRQDFPQIPLEFAFTEEGQRRLDEGPFYGPLPRQLGTAELGEIAFDPLNVLGVPEFTRATRPLLEAGEELLERGVKRAGRELLEPQTGRLVERGFAALPPEVPPTGGGAGRDSFRKSVREVGRFFSNQAEADKFVGDVLGPALRREFRGSPSMRVRIGIKGVDTEPFLEVHTSGWRDRLESIGFKYVGDGGFETYYRFPGTPDAPLPAYLQRRLGVAAPPRAGGEAGRRSLADAVTEFDAKQAALPEPPIKPEQIVDVPEGLPGRPGAVVRPVGAEGLPPPPSEIRLLRGKVILPEEDALLVRATDAIRETKPLTAEAQRVISEGRKRQIARAGAAARGVATPGEVGPAFERALAGELGKVGFEPIRPLFTEGEINELLAKYIWSDNSRLVRVGQEAGQVSFDQFNAWKGFQKLFHPDATVIPTQSEFGLLERAFGKDFIRAVMSKRGRGQKVWDTFLDAWNLPRALLATADLSATVRQGGVLATGDPRLAKRAIQFQIKAFGSEDFTRAVTDLIQTDPDFARFTRGPGGQQRLQITDIATSTPLNMREEPFLSRFAGQLPIVRNSERAYTTYLNTLRFYRMKRMVRQIEGIGVQVTDEQLDALSNFINWASGRGPLGPAQVAAPILNGMFFSIRLATSRFALPAALLTRAPGVRGQIAKNMVAYVAAGLSIIELANAAGADVTLNPMSSDAGKIRIGNTRLDIWGGFLPPIRLITQLLTGKRKSASTGTISDVNPADVIGRFGRSKLHPSLGLGVDVVSEEDYLGEDFSIDPKEFLTPDVRRNPILRTVTPLILADIIEALKVDGIWAAAIAGASGLVGVGVTSFVTADQTSRETYNVPYAKLWLYQKDYIRLLTRQASDRDASEFDKIADQHYADLLTIAQSTELSVDEKIDQYFSINTFYTGLRRGTSDAIFGDGDVQTVQGGTPEQQAALQEYYDALDTMKPSPESAVFFRERWNALIPQLEAKWRREGTLEYVQANTNTRQIPRALFDILPDSTKARIRMSSNARVKQEQRMGVPSPQEQAEELREQFAQPTPTPRPTVIQGQRGLQPTPANGAQPTAQPQLQGEELLGRPR